MRLVLATFVAFATLSGAAFAQTSQNQGSSSMQTNQSGNPAVTVKPADSPQSTGSVEPGANSFTETQARSRIEAQGFTNVTDLRKDEQGIWRGRAMKDGQSTTVLLDFRGNVASQ
jgi:protein CpxP